MMAMISLAELQRRIDQGDLSAAAAVSQSLEAIGAHDKTIGAFVCRAKTVGAASAGPLRGITVGIKDIIDTSDLPTEMGSRIYKDWQPRADAPVVAMLKQAGATPGGKNTSAALAACGPTGAPEAQQGWHKPGRAALGSASGV